MAKRNRTPTPGPGGRARSAPVKVDKPFPWGTVLVSVVLAALLIGIVWYAVANQGTGVRNLLQEDDESFGDALVVLEEPARDHVNGTVDYPDYPQRPPAGGAHNGVPQQCDVYDDEISPEHAVHSLEHGAVWVTYRPDLPEDQVEELRSEVEGDPYRLMSPLPGQEAPIVVTAWGRQLEADDASSDDVRRFLSVYTNGRQTPERGAACAGVTTTGRSPVGAGGNPASMPPADEAEESEESAPADAPAPAPTG